MEFFYTSRFSALTKYYSVIEKLFIFYCDFSKYVPENTI